MYIYKMTLRDGTERHVVTQLNKIYDANKELSCRGLNIEKLEYIGEAYVISKTKFV